MLITNFKCPMLTHQIKKSSRLLLLLTEIPQNLKELDEFVMLVFLQELFLNSVEELLRKY